MLNLGLVTTFVALAETGSFVEAARQLCLAQPTVSQQLKKLEMQLGVVLIERSHGGCSLTARGRAVLPQARALLRSAERFAAAAEGDQIAIGCSGNIASYYISKDLKRFVDRVGNGMRWDITCATNPEIAEQLSVGAIDIAAMEWPVPARGVAVRPWRVEPMVVIVPSDHRLAKSRSLTVDQLLELDLIGGEPGSGTGTLLRQALGRRSAKLRVTHNLRNTEAVKSAVEAGLGCSIVLARAVREEVAAGQIAMLTVRGVKLEKTFHIAFPEGLPDEALPMRLADFLSS